MVSQYRSLPELADFPPKVREALWEQAKRDPLAAKDLFWATAIVVLLGGCAWGYTHLFRTDSGTTPLAMLLTASYLIDVILILRYRPVLRRMLEAPGPMDALRYQLAS